RALTVSRGLVFFRAPAGADTPYATTLASVASDGTPGDDDSITASISADGRWVAFATVATNLGDPAAAVFVHDRATGVTTPVASGLPTAFLPAISADGRWVAFWARADVNDPTFDVFVYDRE